MEKVRLGCQRRAMLLAAANGPTVVARCVSRADDVARRRAAQDLHTLGLAELSRAPGYSARGRWQWRQNRLQLTDLGRRVVATYRDTFERGQRVRWSRFAAT